MKARLSLAESLLVILARAQGTARDYDYCFFCCRYCLADIPNQRLKAREKEAGD